MPRVPSAHLGVYETENPKSNANVTPDPDPVEDGSKHHSSDVLGGICGLHASLWGVGPGRKIDVMCDSYDVNTPVESPMSESDHR